MVHKSDAETGVLLGKQALSFLSGGGKTARLISDFDWASTSLGSIETWAQCLRTTVNITLQSPVPIVILWGKDGIMIYNDAYSVFAGRRHPRLLGSKVVEGWPEVADFNRNVMKQVLYGKKLSYKDQRLTLYRNNKPEEVWMDLNYSPVMDEQGKPAGVMAIVTETTQRVLAEQELKASEERFRFMAETLPLKIFITDPMGKTTYFNPQWAEYTGTTIQDLLEKRVLRFLHPDDLQNSMDGWRQAIQKDEPFQNEQRLLRHDGQYRRHVSHVSAMHDNSGKVVSWFGSMTDIEDVLQTAVQKEKLEIVAAGLKEQRAQLMAINKVKDEFISLSSHQLRTPATAVKQYISLVLDGYFGPLTPEQAHSLKVAYESNERQLNIINELLKTAQLDSSHYALSKEYVSIFKLVKESIAEMRTAVQLKGQKIAFTDPGNDAKLRLDRNEIKLVIVNLLENASKYSFPDTTITVTMRITASHVEIEVQDEGVGILKKDARRIFDKFTRIDNELSDTVDGTGLGLYWVKRIIKLHRGTITVHSTIGKGSSFIIRLPL